LLESGTGRLLIVADLFPFKIAVTTDEARIAVLLKTSEALSIARYIQQHSVA
jgi:hypothetical protein